MGFCDPNPHNYFEADLGLWTVGAYDRLAERQTQTVFLSFG